MHLGDSLEYPLLSPINLFDTLGNNGSRQEVQIRKEL